MDSHWEEEEVDTSEGSNRAEPSIIYQAQGRLEALIMPILGSNWAQLRRQDFRPTKANHHINRIRCQFLTLCARSSDHMENESPNGLSYPSPARGALVRINVLFDVY